MLIATLNWIKCEGQRWCNLLTVNLDHQHFWGLEGVYVIWHGGPQPWTVYVGQGVIKDRLAAHRQEREILQYIALGLFVTWAGVPSYTRDGVEVYLAQQLRPKVGKQYPQATPISANLPW